MGKHKKISEAAREIGIEETVLVHWVENRWIAPAEPSCDDLDEEDFARACLIRDLFDDFGVNEPAVDVILHLLDQLHELHIQLRNRRG